MLVMAADMQSRKIEKIVSQHLYHHPANGSPHNAKDNPVRERKVAMTEDTNEHLGSSDCSSRQENETYAEYSFRMARERRLRKEAIAREELERKRQRKEELRKDRERRKQQVSPELMALAGVTKEQALKQAVANAAKAEELDQRKKYGMCICCGDDKDIRKTGHCQECWAELKLGKIAPLQISERQLHSAACRVVRKGTEMS
jgi:hypothetical protein